VDPSEGDQAIIPFPNDDNLGEIVQELVDRDYYAKRRIAETVLHITGVNDDEVSKK
jgi:hypothetical protein